MGLPASLDRNSEDINYHFEIIDSYEKLKQVRCFRKMPIK
jgi:hypothetical protein